MLNQSHTVDVSNHKQLSHAAEVPNTQAAGTDSRIINIGLLNEHQKGVAACNVYQSKVQSLSLEDIMLIGEQAQYGIHFFRNINKSKYFVWWQVWSCNLATIWG